MGHNSSVISQLSKHPISPTSQLTASVLCTPVINSTTVSCIILTEYHIPGTWSNPSSLRRYQVPGAGIPATAEPSIATGPVTPTKIDITLEKQRAIATAAAVAPQV